MRIIEGNYNLDTINGIVDNHMINVELISTLIGKKIGEGGSREVFEYAPDPKYVIKLEYGCSDSNASEVMLWNEVMGLCGDLEWVKDWFAPILWASHNRKIIVQKRTFKTTRKLPEKVPAFFMDVKYDNFGWIGNKFVCHDYGCIYGFIKYEKKFKKHPWYNKHGFLIEE